MNILYPAGVKREWFDRNPNTIVQAYSAGGVAPHVPTSRVSYTVPAGRKAYIMVGFGKSYRDTAATVAGLVEVFFSLTLDTGAQQVMNSTWINNSLNIFQFLNLSNIGWLLPGNKAEIFTRDASTGGSCTFFASIAVLEFDA